MEIAFRFLYPDCRTVWDALGCMAGAAMAVAPGWDRHVQWCLDHHPGYDPHANPFIGRDGYPHVCR